MNWLVMIIVLVLIGYILRQRHYVKLLREVTRFQSYYAKNLKLSVDLHRMAEKRTILLMRSLGYDPDVIAGGDSTQHKPTPQELDEIMAEHYKIESKTKWINARFEVEMEEYKGEFE